MGGANVWGGEERRREAGRDKVQCGANEGEIEREREWLGAGFNLSEA